MNEEEAVGNTSLWVNPVMSVFLLFHYDVFRYDRNKELTPLSVREKQNVQKRLCTSLQGETWSPYQKNQMILRYLKADLEHMCEGLQPHEVTLFVLGCDQFAIRKKPLRDGGRREKCDSVSSNVHSTKEVEVSFS